MKMLLREIVLLLTLLPFSYCQPAPSPKVGDLVTRHPYIVSIRADDVGICAGALIGEYTIITAAECIDPFRGRDRLPLLWLNATRNEQLTEDTVIRQTVESIIHPNYTGDAVDGYNLALLRLNETALPLRQIRVPSFSVEIEPQRILTVISYGARSFSGEAANRLQIGQVRVLEPTNCINANIGYIEDQMFCTDSQVPCANNPGGLVFFGRDRQSEVLVGIVSGTRCVQNSDLSGITSIVTEETSAWIQQQRTAIEELGRAETSPTVNQATDLSSPQLESPPAEAPDTESPPAEAPDTEADDIYELLDLLL